MLKFTNKNTLFAITKERTDEWVTFYAYKIRNFNASFSFEKKEELLDFEESFILTSEKVTETDPDI